MVPDTPVHHRPVTPLARERDFDEVMRLIGRLNYSWTNTESLLIHLIAGLAGTGKETALIIYLTLNTTRARIDLIERLAKMEGRDPVEMRRVLELTRELQGLAGLRNLYNHCIYAFDPSDGSPRTIQMRIADRKDGIKMGRVEQLDGAARADIEAAIEALQHLNRAFWRLVLDRGYPA